MITLISFTLTVDGGGVEDIPNFDLAIISNSKKLIEQTRILESQGFPRDKIIDGRVFKVPNLDFQRFLKEGVAYGFYGANPFSITSRTIYPQVYNFVNHRTKISLGVKSYTGAATNIEGEGTIAIGNYCCISWCVRFIIGLNGDHNYHKISVVAVPDWEWEIPKGFYPPRGKGQINIGNDVWIGRGCTLKSANPNKPLVIGDGAVIASESVVVKNVPPYAIVGGNPAKVIKYRFPPHVIKALLRIKWWDWSLDKIHDNFKYFNDVEKFISLHDPLKDADTPEDEKFLSYDIENTFDLDMDKISNNFR